MNPTRTCGTPDCPGCGAPTARASYIGERGCVVLWRCDRCRLVFADRAIWKDPYAGTDYYAVDSWGPDLRAQPCRTHENRVDFMTRWVRGGRYLDFGGGLGETAIVAMRRGFQSTVIEDSRKAIEIGRAQFPSIEWSAGNTIPDGIPDGTYDLVSAFHVVEHLLEPRPMLAKMRRILKPGGCLCIEVPNWGSHLRRLRGMNWIFVLDHHVNHFDLATLSRTVEPVGFRCVGHEFRRTFGVNEQQPWKEPLKAALSRLGFGDILRAMYRRIEPNGA